jgi:hypothetical protein
MLGNLPMNRFGGYFGVITGGKPGTSPKMGMLNSIILPVGWIRYCISLFCCGGG